MSLKPRNQSLSFQSLILIMGRVLSLPIGFLLPIIMVRYFNPTEFGQYRQLFIIYYAIQSFLDLGISQGIIYFLPKDPERKREHMASFLVLQGMIVLLQMGLFYYAQEEIALVFTKEVAVAGFIPLIGISLGIWTFSNNLEMLLIAEKKTTHASIFIFFSNGIKSLIIILVILGGGDLRDLLFTYAMVGGLRLVWLVWYLTKNQYFRLNFELFSVICKSQLKYCLPLGMALIINSLIDYSHQLIVSNQLTAADFAVYSIGCFQVPFIGIVTLSVSRVALVKLVELHEKGMINQFVQVVANSIRKMALIFIPLFALFWVTAEEFIILLYTPQYSESVHVFRVFIWILPTATFMVEYIPRAIGESRYIFKVNVMTLVFNIIAVFMLLYWFGIIGAALGFVLSRVFRKVLCLIFLSKQLNVSAASFIPVKELLRICICVIVSMLPFGLLSHELLVHYSPCVSLAVCWLGFGVLCLAMFWFRGVLRVDEKLSFTRYVSKVCSLAKNICHM